MDLPIPGETYEHFKGKVYRVEKITTDAETLEQRVVYTDGDITWDRVVSGVSPITGNMCGWCDPRPNGEPRYVKVS